MARPGPKPGQRPSGRSKGTPNRSTDEARLLIEAACPGWNSLQAMARAAQRGAFEVWDPMTDAPKRNDDGSIVLVPISDKTRGTLLKELNEYQYAKRRAIEITNGEDNPLQLGLQISFHDPEPDDQT